jgi:hypothetical protein
MWKDIKGYEGLYQINEYGEVKSLSRIVINNGGKQVLPERILKPSVVGKGYLKVDLRKNNKTKRYYIHKLVAEHFLENKYNYKIVNHKDGNKLNNHYKNLEWVTYSQNNIHAYENNLKQKGEKYYNAKLTDEQVKKIIINGKGNNTYQEIADIYGVARATIRDILIKKTWKHIHAQLENSNDYPVRE